MQAIPYETGVAGYPAYELARKSGAYGEIGPNNEVRAVSVVPAPYQKPHPPVFVATSASKDSAIYCGKKGFVPCYFAPIDKAVEHGQACWEAARAAGHNIRFGEKQALVRLFHVEARSRRAGVPARGGTGSGPPAAHGWQRSSRRIPNQAPRTGPCRRIASAAYREQLGW